MRASGYGPVRVLVPMVSSREEIVAVRALLKRVARDLRSAGHEIAEHIPLGAMIEVPAAAIALPGFIGIVDFLSIGTNDLVQYLLAADRNNEALGELYTPLHPAVLRLLRDVIRLAGKRGKPVAVCGEMAGDPLFAPLLLALGLDGVQPASGHAAGSAPRDPRLRPRRTARARAGAAARARPRGHRDAGCEQLRRTGCAALSRLHRHRQPAARSARTTRRAGQRRHSQAIMPRMNA